MRLASRVTKPSVPYTDILPRCDLIEDEERSQVAQRDQEGENRDPELMGLRLPSL
jgi:hypothetical protein